MMKIPYSELRRLLKGEPYTMSLVGREGQCVIDAVNRGIDDHLEACNCPSRGDVYFSNKREGRLECIVSVESFPTLCRRLCEDLGPEEEDSRDDVSGMGLVVSILESLDYQGDAMWGCFEIVHDNEMTLFDLSLVLPEAQDADFQEG